MTLVRVMVPQYFVLFRVRPVQLTSLSRPGDNGPVIGLVRPRPGPNITTSPPQTKAFFTRTRLVLGEPRVLEVNASCVS